MRRLNIRWKFRGYTFFCTLSKHQTLGGLGSCVNWKEHLHNIYWDLDRCTLEQAIQTLQEIQKEFKLGDIFITSDYKKSYRAWCFSVRKWLEYLHILLHTMEYNIIDYGFWIWTIRRGEATLRNTNKKERQMHDIVAILKGYEKTQLPEKFKVIKYDTGIQKKGIFITNFR